MTHKIFCAIDTTDLDQALSWVTDIKPHIHGLKIGMEFFYTHGHLGVARILNAAHPDSLLFLDLKFHDIPNTVAGAIRAVLPLNPAFLTVHANGGISMMKSAVEATHQSNTAPKILAVTLLTHLTKSDLENTDVKDNIQTHVCRLAEQSFKAGVDGLVCSPHEISTLRKEFGHDFTLMVPGIRPKLMMPADDDQSRVMTPKEAIKLGADHLVIGRPITKAQNPAKAAENIVQEI